MASGTPRSAFAPLRKCVNLEVAMHMMGNAVWSNGLHGESRLTMILRLKDFDKMVAIFLFYFINISTCLRYDILRGNGKV